MALVTIADVAVSGQGKAQVKILTYAPFNGIDIMTLDAIERETHFGVVGNVGGQIIVAMAVFAFVSDGLESERVPTGMAVVARNNSVGSL